MSKESVLDTFSILAEDEEIILTRIQESEFEKYKEKVTFIKADVSNEYEVTKMFNQIEKLDYLMERWAYLEELAENSK